MVRRHEDDDAFEQAVRHCIPAEFNLIAGNEDDEEAQESYKASKAFNLPNPIGPEGGACTSSLLQVLYKHVDTVCPAQPGGGPSMTFQQLGKEMHAGLKAKRFDNVPQFSSSRPIGPPGCSAKDRPFYIVPPRCRNGRRRALLIGCNYTGQRGALRAPHNDCYNVEQFLRRKCKWDADDMMILMDDGKHTSPTRQNIEDGFAKLATESSPNDVVFVLYSGHGGRVKDKSGDEEDGFDSSIFPVDYLKAGQIIDDDILKHLIKRMPAGVHCTMVVDACHSGTIGDLPYQWSADAKTQQIETSFDTSTYEEAMAKDAAKQSKEDERQRAKAERKQKREEIRRRKAEAAAREEAGLPPLNQPQFLQQPAMMMANPQAFAQQFASQFGGGGGGGSGGTSSPMMMFSNNGGGVQVVQQQQQPPRQVVPVGTPVVVTPPQPQQQPAATTTTTTTPSTTPRVGRSPPRTQTSSHSPTPPTNHSKTKKSSSFSPGPVARETTSSKSRSPAHPRPAASNVPQKASTSHSPAPTRGTAASSSLSHSPVPAPAATATPVRNHSPVPQTSVGAAGRPLTSHSPPPPANKDKDDKVQEALETSQKQAKKAADWTQKNGKKALAFTQKNFQKASAATKKHTSTLMEKESTKKAQDSVKKAWAWTQKTGKKAGEATHKHTSSMLDKAKAARGAPKNNSSSSASS